MLVKHENAESGNQVQECSKEFLLLIIIEFWPVFV